MKKLPNLLILAGGKGTRLGDISLNVPKGLIDINGTNAIVSIIEQYSKAEGDKVILALGYLSDKYKEHFKANNFSVEVEFSCEESPLGTGGAIKHALGKISGEEFFVANGDTFFEVDFQEMHKEFIKKNRPDVFIACSSVQKEENDFGNINISKNGEILSFLEKEAGKGWKNAGVYLLKKSIFKNISDTVFSIEEDLFQKSLPKKFAFKVDSEFYDIGTPERLDKARESLKK